VVSPVLSNIYLDRLDQFVETVLLPASNRGPDRRPYPPYMALLNAARKQRLAGEREAAMRLRRQAQHLPARAPNAPHFRRWLLLDSRVVDVLRLSNLILVIFSSLKPLFFSDLKKAWPFSGNVGA
jgi:hypothetical protein